MSKATLLQIDGKLPNQEVILATAKNGSRRALVAARADVAPIVRQETPHRTGKLADEVAPRITDTPDGLALVVGPPKGRRHGKITVAQLALLIQRGTGVNRTGAGPKSPIRAKRPLGRLHFAGVFRVSVAGQKPNRFMLRIEQRATPRVRRLAQEGAEITARELERVS